MTKPDEWPDPITGASAGTITLVSHGSGRGYARA